MRFDHSTMDVSMMHYIVRSTHFRNGNMYIAAAEEYALQPEHARGFFGGWVFLDLRRGCIGRLDGAQRVRMAGYKVFIGGISEETSDAVLHAAGCSRSRSREARSPFSSIQRRSLFSRRSRNMICDRIMQTIRRPSIKLLKCLWGIK